MQRLVKKNNKEGNGESEILFADTLAMLNCVHAIQYRTGFAVRVCTSFRINASQTPVFGTESHQFDSIQPFRPAVYFRPTCR